VNGLGLVVTMIVLLWIDLMFIVGMGVTFEEMVHPVG
jgi:hypothetical protein